MDDLGTVGYIILHSHLEKALNIQMFNYTFSDTNICLHFRLPAEKHQHNGEKTSALCSIMKTVAYLDPSKAFSMNTLHSHSYLEGMI